MTAHAISARVGRVTRRACCVGAVALTGALVAGCGSSSAPVTPTTPAQKFSAGLAALTQGKDQQAATYFKELVAANPRDSNAEYNLGLAEAYLNEPAAAEAAYQRAIAIDPKMTSALYNLADLQEAHDPQLAIATLRRVLAIDPNNTSAQFNLGYWLEQRGKIAEGEALLGKAIAADPSLRSRVPAGIKLPASAG